MMKTLIVVFALMALSSAEEPKSEESIKQKRGLLDYGHASLLQAPILTKSLDTPIIHAGPVVTKVFDSPSLPLVRNWGGPLVSGPLITRGIGPHILGAKTILPAPIYSAPILKAAPIITAHAPLAAPIAIGAYGHGWGNGWGNTWGHGWGHGW